MNSRQFAHWFRASSPYIREHRNKTFLIVLKAAVLRSPLLANIVQDLALLNVLEIRLILILEPESASTNPIVTETEMIGDLETARDIMHHLESLFNTGIPASQFRHRHVPVVSGNFVSARPLGVIDGVDHDFAGSVRRVHHDEVKELLDLGHVVLVPPFGYSTTGKTYQVKPHELILAFATSLEPAKVIVFQEPEIIDSDLAATTSNLTTVQLGEVLANDQIPTHIQEWLETLISCCRAGVPRCHIVSHQDDGALLQELFTPDGSGLQISDTPYRLIRRASTEDVSSIIELLKPFEEDGSLVKRNRNLLLASINSFFVAELDDTIVGTVCLYEMHEGVQEIGSLATVPDHRDASLGKELLSRAEAEARKLGARCALVKTTQAVEWFIENGYMNTVVTELPRSAQRGYDKSRNPKVLIKSLS